MAKFRIIQTGDYYRIEKNHWFFGWDLVGYERILSDAKKYIKNLRNGKIVHNEKIVYIE